MKPIFNLASILLGSALLIACLYFNSLRGTNHKNGFLRLFPPHVINFSKQLQLNIEHAYFVKADSASIYLADYQSAAQIFKIDSDLSLIKTVAVDNPEKDAFTTSQTKIMAYDTNFLRIEQFRSIIFQSSLRYGGKAKVMIDSPFLSSTASVCISNSSFILRTYYDSLKQNILAKKRIGSRDVLYGIKTLEKQVDGLFSVDGNLLWNDQCHRIFYVYTYRNQIVCMDSSLNIQYKSRTVDTNTQAKITVSAIDKSISTFASPPLLVNRLAATYGNYLFVNSVLKANNEVVANFDNYAVIDVYRTLNGRYAFSFYVTKSRGNNIASMKLWKNKLFLIEGQDLFEYTLADALLR